MTTTETTPQLFTLNDAMALGRLIEAVQRKAEVAWCVGGHTWKRGHLRSLEARTDGGKGWEPATGDGHDVLDLWVHMHLDGVPIAPSVRDSVYRLKSGSFIIDPDGTN